MRGPDSAARFDRAINGIFDRIEDKPDQFPEHALLTVQNGRPLFFSVRRAVFPKPFAYVLFFYVREGVAIVLAIAHGRRRPEYWAHRR